jgi:hypothetical protein
MAFSDQLSFLPGCDCILTRVSGPLPSQAFRYVLWSRCCDQATPSQFTPQNSSAELTCKAMARQCYCGPIVRVSCFLANLRTGRGSFLVTDSRNGVGRRSTREISPRYKRNNSPPNFCLKTLKPRSLPSETFGKTSPISYHSQPSSFAPVMACQNNR